MEVESFEGYVAHLLALGDDCLHVFHGYAELVFGEACGDVGMCVRTYVGVDAEADVGSLLLGACYLVDDFEFGYALYVEAEDACFESEFYLPVALSDSCKDYLVGWKACFEHLLYFTS